MASGEKRSIDNTLDVVADQKIPCLEYNDTNSALPSTGRYFLQAKYFNLALAAVRPCMYTAEATWQKKQVGIFCSSCSSSPVPDYSSVLRVAPTHSLTVSFNFQCMSWFARRRAEEGGCMLCVKGAMFFRRQGLGIYASVGELVQVPAVVLSSRDISSHYDFGVGRSSMWRDSFHSSVNWGKGKGYHKYNRRRNRGKSKIEGRHGGMGTFKL